ncbi:hypothetical protein N781_14155 [Pontibacillus halophilus JSM 076056 = DSM 19796]|uniref:Helix-turn-helix domain-containing protein n=1 Tax=Pontibacillus halophilus JSM 076056 = DSM 19796 TaxID=1385510 RepID=A0A0A5GPE8_9BACI|nr:excisionase family DNA-binding protein [Pontibacillus halophilus]KGX93010.1 hypothetical protein N781_14155 [Pontibacillus halophilus JSM 076056 = DSM 19796]
MYRTIEETAEYLELPVTYIQSLILRNKIRTIHDGQRYLINSNQFTSYFEQMDKYRQMIQEYLNEPIPESMDVNDED